MHQKPPLPFPRQNVLHVIKLAHGDKGLMTAIERFLSFSKLDDPGIKRVVKDRRKPVHGDGTALGIVQPLPVSKMLNLYVNEGSEIFPSNRWFSKVRWYRKAKFDYEVLEEKLKKYLGNWPLYEAKTRCMIVSYDTQKCGAIFFKSWKDEYNTYKAWEVARATSAPISYFHRYGPFTDGGVVANNPSMAAYAEARRLWPNEELLLVSIGCGQHILPIPDDDNEGWRFWINHVGGAVMDAQSDAIEYYVKRTATNTQYHRIQIELQPGKGIFDDGSEKNIEYLQLEGNNMIQYNEKTLDTIISLLDVS